MKRFTLTVVSALFIFSALISPTSAQTPTVEEAPAHTQYPLTIDNCGMTLTFDLVWSENAIWGGMVGENYRTIAELVRVLKSGGHIAFFYSNMYRAMMLPGLPQLEHGLYRADALR